MIKTMLEMDFSVISNDLSGGTEQRFGLKGLDAVARMCYD